MSWTGMREDSGKIEGEGVKEVDGETVDEEEGEKSLLMLFPPEDGSLFG